MKSTEKIIVERITAEKGSYVMKNGRVLVAVKHGEITFVTRNGGPADLSERDGTEWYSVDENEYMYDLSYNGGGIRFNFSFAAKAAFPTLLVCQKDLAGTDMQAIILEWASSQHIANTVTGILEHNDITTEKQLFEDSTCEKIENELKTIYRETFLKKWGMLLNSVTIIKKKPETNQPTKGSIYDLLF